MTSTGRYEYADPGGYGSLNGSMQAFLAEVQEDLAQGMLPTRVLNDPELHRAELDRVFTRCWVYVGHVSEIPSPGDYVLRYIGEDQFIMVRDEHGEIQLLMNNCVHRASPVCRAEKGNASHFRCPYHGWIYKNSGEWNGAPRRAQAYRKLDSARWGLLKAPHVDTYQGLIFACLDPAAVSLREYLGDMCWYLDTLFDLNEQGMAVYGDPHRWVVPANWKSGAENFVGDAYHVGSAHESLEHMGYAPGMKDIVYGGGFHGTFTDQPGHGLVMNPALPPELAPNPWGYPPEVAETFDLERLNPEQREFIKRFSLTGFTIFPNLSIINTVGSLEIGGPLYRFMSLRQWQPRGPDQFELWNWPLVWKTAPQEYNEKSYNAAVKTFSSSGIFEQDDTVVWRGGPMVGRSPFARKHMKLNLQMGMDGMSDYEPRDDWPGPGVGSTTLYGEPNQRMWWQRWAQELAKV